MLTIRLSRTGRKNLAQYRIVLTEHTKPVKAGYKEVLGQYDPLRDIFTFDADAAKKYIAQGATVSERVAKLAYRQSKDSVFQKFFVHKNITRAVKNPDKYTK